MKSPFVSIGLPVYNGEAFLVRALEAILHQEHENTEVVISDNASTDGTESLCREYAQRDARVRYFRNEHNLGVNPNHDRVFHLSRGEYFMWTAHDVEFAPRMISRCLAVMQESGAVLAYPRCEMVVNGSPLPVEGSKGSIASDDRRPYRRLDSVIRNVVMVNQLYGLMKREALARTRLNGSYPSSDYVLLAELAMLGRIVEIPEVLLRRWVDTDRGTAAVCHDKKAWQTWLDPRRRANVLNMVPHRERLALEYFLGAWHLPLKPWDKLMCLLVGPIAPYWRAFLRFSGPWRTAVRGSTRAVASTLDPTETQQ